MMDNKTQKQVAWLFRYCIVLTMIFLSFLFYSFREAHTPRFEEINVERINIIEKDGTVKMIITNKDKFPTGDELVNQRPTNKTREKRPGMLFFNDEGIEAGGFIYDGSKTKVGHSGGMSLTFDRYDGDQVMQILSTDVLQNGKRMSIHGLAFNDYANDTLTQQGFARWMDKLNTLKYSEEKQKLESEMQQNGMFATPRIYLGRTGSENNGLYLFDNKGQPRLMLYIGPDNKAKLEFYNEQGKVVDSWPK